MHAYAPANVVADEMHRLVGELGSPAFEGAHPVLKVAYAHHALTHIHPFADGNGRVARALASVYLLRAVSLPLWIETSERDRYLDALEQADQGDVGPWCEVIARATLRLIREISVSLWGSVESISDQRAAEEPACEEALTVLSRRFADHLGAAALFRGLATDPLSGKTVPGLKVNLERVGGKERTVAVVSDPAADQSARFLTISGLDDDHHNELERADLREPFEASEFLPSLTDGARRRLESIADAICRRAEGGDQ